MELVKADLVKSPITPLFREGVATVVRDFSEADIGRLHRDEVQYVERAAQRRKMEFAAGRAGAREALAQLGIENFPLLVGEQRAPVWPEGYAGSISHSQECAAVAVMRQPEGKNIFIGVDIEKADRLAPRLWKMTFNKDEIEWLERLNASEQVNLMSTAMFAAKEAFYKAQFPASKVWVGFSDASVRLNTEDRTFRLVLRKKLTREWSEGVEFSGKYLFFKGFVAAGIELEAGGC